MLLLGLIINFLVAWGLSLIPHTLGPANTKAVQLSWNDEDGERRMVYLLRHQWFGIVENQYHQTHRSRSHDRPNQISIWWSWTPLDLFEPNPIEQSQALANRFQPENPDATVLSRVRYGFPALSLQGRSMIDDSAPQANGTYETQTRGIFFDRIDANNTLGKPEVWPHAQHLWFPYHPIWAGLIINTLFYACISAMVLYLVIRVRNARRMLRGRCPYCAYEMHHDFSLGCPECGWRC